MPGDYLALRSIDRIGLGGNPCQAVRLIGGWKAEDLGAPFGEDNADNTTWFPVRNIVDYMAADGTRRTFALAEIAGGGAVQVYQLNELTGAWASVHVANTGGTPVAGSGFVHVTGSDGKPYLVVVYQGTGLIARFNTYDGTSWTTFTSGATQLDSAWWAITYKGVLYLKARSNSGAADSIITAYDPVTGVFSPGAYTPFFERVLGADFLFTVGKRLFYVCNGSTGNDPQLIEFIAGSWLHIGSLQGEVPNMRASGALAHAAVYNLSTTKTLIIRNGSSLTSGVACNGLRAYLAELVAGVLTFSDVTDPVVPAFLRPISSVGSLAQYLYGCQAVTDNSLTPGTPQHFLYFNPALTAGWNLPWSIWTVVDEGTEIQLIETTEADGRFIMPDSIPGGSQFSHYPDGLQIGVLDTGVDDAGLKITYRCNNGPLTVNHGVVGGGPFEVGQTMTSSSGGSATILTSTGTVVTLSRVTGTFNDTDTLTQTTGPNTGATATQSGASTLAANNTVRFRYVNSFGVPVTLGTLVAGSATGGSSAVLGSEVQNVTADPSIEYTVVWDFLTDGVPNASRLDIQAFLVRG